MSTHGGRGSTRAAGHRIIGRSAPLCGALVLWFFSFHPSRTQAAGLADKFDADKAFAHVRKQVDLGPRPSGSKELEQTRAYLISQLQSSGLEIEEQTFSQDTPRGLTKFTNIRARLSTSFTRRLWRGKKQLIILASHYDTKWLPQIRFVGANDGGSSTGVLLELARVVATSSFQPKTADLEFVFFDGEEAMKDYTHADGLFGSRYYVENWKAHGSKPGIKAMILMDMIGDRDLSIQIPNGTPEWVGRIFRASHALGYRSYFHSESHSVLDDHDPFIEVGVAAIDLIDFEFGQNNSWWHTAEDTLDKVDSKSLKIVGQTILKLLENE